MIFTWFGRLPLDLDKLPRLSRPLGSLDALLLGGLLAGLGLAFRFWLRARAQERKGLEDRLDLLMRQGSDILFLLDRTGSILDANERAVTTYGLSVEVLRGTPIQAFRTAEEATGFKDAFESARNGHPTRYETRHRNASGNLFPVEVTLRPVILGETPYVAAFLRDITEQERKSAALLRLNRLYAMLSHINQAILASESQGELLPRLARILVETGPFRAAWIRLKEGPEAFAPHGEGESRPPLGVPPTGGEARLHNHLDATEPWHGPAIAQGIASVAGIPIQLGRALLGDLVVGAPEADFFGAEEMQLMNEAARDMAFALHHLEREEVRKRAEAALRENETFLFQAQEVGMVGIYRFDLQGDRWESSPFLDRLLGISQDHPRTTESWLELVEPGSRDAMRTYLETVIRERASFDREYPILRHRDQELRWLHGRGEMEAAEPGKPPRMIGVIQDVTARVKADQERRDLEVHLHQVQQLESLGILAGGIAHDMNNVLAAVMAMASVQAGAAAPQSPLAMSMETIIRACERGREVVKGILFFARKNQPQIRDVNLNTVAQDITQLLSFTTLKRINLHMDLDPNLATIRADAVAIAHALMNLCVNAVDAMPEGGPLTIRTGLAADGGIELEVRDAGEGMPPGVLERALEPFFTTKPAGKGTGMGLAIVHATMQAHDGELRITSHPGSGTRVLLRFPESRKIREAAGNPPMPLPLQAGRALRVLLVEDDPIVRLTSREVLSSLGHRVEVTENGLKALEWLERGGEADVVILDMNMPVLSGAQTLPRILSLRPKQHVIVVSGYLDTDARLLLQKYPAVLGLEKPFSLRELEAKLGELSESPGHPSAPPPIGSKP